MDIDFTTNSNKQLRRQLIEWSEAMFTAKKGKADINSVMLYSPLIQMVSNELTGRFVKLTTWIAMGVAVLSLLVSLVALYVASTSAVASTRAAVETRVAPPIDDNELSRTLRRRAKEAFSADQ